MSNRSQHPGHPRPVGAPSRLSLGIDSDETKQEHLSQTVSAGARRAKAGCLARATARQARLFLAARLTRFSLPNQNIENNPMQSNKGSLAWMLLPAKTF